MPAKSDPDNPRPTSKPESSNPPSIDTAENSGTQSLPSTDKDELNSFREDYRQLEDDIQSYFRVYYLSGIAGFLAWMLGTKSTSAVEILFGNGGYNVYALMAIGLLNMVTTTFLLYKGIAVHEIAQFMFKESAPSSAFRKWEKWRRGSDSVAGLYRRVYSALLIAVPLATSILILWILGKVIFTAPEQLMDFTTAAAAVSNSPFSNKGYIAHLKSVFAGARWFFVPLLILHFIPAWFTYVSVRHIPKSWKKFSV